MILLNDGTLIDTLTVISNKDTVRGNSRACLTINLTDEAVKKASGNEDCKVYDYLKEKFADGVQITIREIVPSVDDEGQPTTVTNDYQHFEYVLLGRITDNMNGTWVVVVGQKTNVEVVEEENAELLLMAAGAEE